MSVSVSYPGVYVQELPLSTHTITPAPTSITAFVGYTHPYKTLAFNKAVQLFSFSDYEANFGGLYTSGNISSDVARAVYEFFQNGGNNAYVLGLQPSAYGGGDNSLGKFGLPPVGTIVATTTIETNGKTNDIANGLQFTALELTDIVPMTLRIMNIGKSVTTGSYDTFDLVITYGTRNETYRSLTLDPDGKGATITNRLISSSLVTVQAPQGATFGTQFNSSTAPKPQNILLTTLSSEFVTSYSASDFIPAFQENQPLDLVEIINLLLIPGVADNSVVSAALAFAERKRAFAILDPPEQAPAVTVGTGPLSINKIMGSGVIPLSQNGALYFPYLLSTDPVTGHPIAMPPSGYVAGIYAQTDTSRGVWKAPAGLATPLLDTVGPVSTGAMNDMQQGVLNQAAVNCIRSFTGYGTVVYGARTLVGTSTPPSVFPQSIYVPVRRMTLFIEQTLVSNLKWAVFEPNDWPLWVAIRSEIEAFLLSLFNQQALQGSTPSQAFAVKCDATTTTPDDQANGIVNIVVGVALLKPAEFVVIKIAQIAGQTGS